MNESKKTISIIGGGIGGLATAVLMAKDGHQVDVYEKNECLGGRASIFSANGYTFDMGPSRYLMPDLFERFFAEIGEDIHDHLDLAQLSPSYKVFYPGEVTEGSKKQQEAKQSGVPNAFGIEKDRDVLVAGQFGTNNINRNITPLFDQFPIKENMPTVERNIGIAIVYNPTTDSYLCLKRAADQAQNFVGGGIEDAEDAIQATMREVHEETGYKNIRLITELPAYRSQYRHETKGANYHTKCRAFVYELIDDTQDPIDPKELVKHTPQRIPADQVTNFLTNTGHTPSYDHLFLWDEWCKQKHQPTNSLIHQLASMNIYADIERMANIFEEMERGSGQKFRDFLKRSGEQYHIGMEFATKNYDSIFDFFRRDIALKGMKLNIWTTIDKYVARFFHTPIIQKIMQYTTVFLGTAPSSTPAFYNIMSHVDFAMGVRYPQGGLHAVAQALVKIGEKYGVRYHTDSEVIKVESQKSKVESMTLKNGKTISSDLFIVNADQARFETEMLMPEHQTYTKPYRDKKTFAPSGFIIYAGIGKKLDKLEHHNLYFNDNRAESFGDIYERHILPSEPSIYVCTPSKTDPTVAPSGKENLFILVPIPNGITISDEEKQIYRDKIWKIVEDMAGESLLPYLEYEQIFEVQDFKDRYNAWNGTALGLGHTMMQTACFRPNNYSKKLDNLFYVGHNTNPGIGVPMVIVSAMLVKERIEERVLKK